MKRVLLTAVLLSAFPPVARGQAVPEGSQAYRVDRGYRRTPTMLVDPFRHVMIPHWGVMFSAGGVAENNVLNLNDVGAIRFLADEDSLLFGDVIDAFGLIPQGAGVGGFGQGEVGAFLGGPLGSHLSIGFSGQVRAYGNFSLSDSAVALLRDGNGLQQSFNLGSSNGAALVTAEAGAHAILRVGPLGTVDGVNLSLGYGGRKIWPVYYGRSATLIDGGSVMVTPDSIRGKIQIEALTTILGDAFTNVFDRGSGYASDFLVRMEWPTSGVAFEAMVFNVGTVTIDSVERQTLDFDVSTTVLDTVFDVLDTLDFKVQDTSAVTIDLPATARFTASAWANRILQLDVAATIPLTDQFDSPVRVDLGSTWRFTRNLPLRFGVVLGGEQGVGYTAGFAVETRNFLFGVTGQSLGGVFRNATGAGGRFELGFFF